MQLEAPKPRSGQPHQFRAPTDMVTANKSTTSGTINYLYYSYTSTRTMSSQGEEPKKFEPKKPVQLDPPKDDPISLEYLSKCDGENIHTSYQFVQGLRQQDSMQAQIKIFPLLWQSRYCKPSRVFNFKLTGSFAVRLTHLHN